MIQKFYGVKPRHKKKHEHTYACIHTCIKFTKRATARKQWYCKRWVCFTSQKRIIVCFKDPLICFNATCSLFFEAFAHFRLCFSAHK